jgi:hypothetical protein
MNKLDKVQEFINKYNKRPPSKGNNKYINSLGGFINTC